MELAILSDVLADQVRHPVVVFHDGIYVEAIPSAVAEVICIRRAADTGSDEIAIYLHDRVMPNSVGFHLATPGSTRAEIDGKSTSSPALGP